GIGAEREDRRGDVGLEQQRRDEALEQETLSPGEGRGTLFDGRRGERPCGFVQRRGLANRRRRLRSGLEQRRRSRQLVEDGRRRSKEESLGIFGGEVLGGRDTGSVF